MGLREKHEWIQFSYVFIPSNCLEIYGDWVLEMTTANTLNIAVVGAGDMGQRHAQHWQHAGATVSAICDAYVPQAEKIAANFGAQAFETLEAALASAAIDAVSICTPTFLHAPLAIAALDAGKHVLCEKPIALTLTDALAMKDAANKANKELRVGFMRRFDPAYPQLVDACTRIGSPILASATIAAGIRPKRLMHDAKANGGPIIDMCCHVFNLWEGILGCRPTQVSARGYTFSDNKIELTSIEHKALDSAHITLHYPNGAFGHIQVSWGLPWGVPALEHHTYLAPEGIVQTSWNETITFDHGQGVTHWQRQGDLNYLDPWRREIAQFYCELTTGAPQQVASADDGIEALKISLAVLEAIHTEQTIDLATFGLVA